MESIRRLWDSIPNFWKNPNKLLKIVQNKPNIKMNTETPKLTNSNYKRVEKNITKIGSSSYRVRVGKLNKCVPTRQAARDLKRTWLNPTV